MDLDSLEQLLHCPICFERFDGTNRVLPCQHTFCKKCLETVKTRFKELRCPECRTKFNGYIKDLPCNIFVIRVLEQLRQAEVKTQQPILVSAIQTCSSRSEREKTSDRRKNKISRPKSPDCVSIGLSSLSVVEENGSSSLRSPDQEVPALPSSAQIGETSNDISWRPRFEASRQDVNRNSSTNSSFSNPLSEFWDSPSSSNIFEPSVTFSSNAYKFSVELKSDKRNPNALRRMKKNYLACCQKSTVVPNSVHQTEVSSVNTPEKTIHVFNPNNYSFSVELKSDTRSYGNQRRPRRYNGSIMKPPVFNVPKWI